MSSPDIRPFTPEQETGEKKQITGVPNVLIVDDDPALLGMVGDMLEGYPVNLHFALSPDEARSIMKKVEVGVALIDLSADKDMALFEELKAGIPDCRRIAFTGDVRAREIETPKFHSILLKPFDLSDLEKTIDDNVDLWKKAQGSRIQSPQTIVDFKK